MPAPSGRKGIDWTAEAHEKLLVLILKHANGAMSFDIPAIADELGTSASGVRQHIALLKRKHPNPASSDKPALDKSTSSKETKKRKPKSGDTKKEMKPEKSCSGFKLEDEGEEALLESVEKDEAGISEEEKEPQSKKRKVTQSK